MQYLNYAKTSLASIIDKDTDFRVAVKESLKDVKYVKDDIQTIASTVGACLRHFNVLNNYVNENIPNLSNDDKYSVLVLLANKYYSKRIGYDDFMSYINSHFEGDLFDIVSHLVNLDNEPKDLIPERFKNKQNDFEYLSLRYNIPMWTIKMWCKHFGYNLMFKLAASISKPVNPFFACREGAEDKLADNVSFSKLENGNAYSYVGKENPYKNDLVIGNELVETCPAMEYLLDQVDLDSLRGIGMFISTLSNLPILLSTRIPHNYKAEVMIENENSFFYNKKIAKSCGLKDLTFYEVKASSVIACLSKPVHTLFVYPNSTNFALIKHEADFFVHFKVDEIDEIIKNERLALDECAPFVEEGGQLVYIINTANHKEGCDLIKGFLKEHPDYVLEQEKQFLSFDKYHSVMYYAILKKASIAHD